MQTKNEEEEEAEEENDDQENSIVWHSIKKYKMWDEARMLLALCLW